MTDKKIFSDKITKGNRTYFFDIKRSEQGDLYLKISESKKTNSGFEHHRLMVFDKDMKYFVDTLRKTLAKFKELQAPQTTDGKKYSVEKIRQSHQQAYLPWAAEGGNKLEVLLCEGKKTKELAQIFRRKEGAINSRIKKLELREKYGR